MIPDACYFSKKKKTFKMQVLVILAKCMFTCMCGQCRICQSFCPIASLPSISRSTIVTTSINPIHPPTHPRSVNINYNKKILLNIKETVFNCFIPVISSINLTKTKVASIKVI